MTCRNVSRQLSAYLDQELSGVESLEIRAHLTDCQNCSAELEMLRQLKLKLSAVVMVEPPEGTYSRIKTAVHSPELVRVRRHRAFGLMAMTACMGALLTAMVLARVESQRDDQVAGTPATSARDSVIGDSYQPVASQPVSAQSPMIQVELSR